jgi:hypothetical protein
LIPVRRLCNTPLPWEGGDISLDSSASVYNLFGRHGSFARIFANIKCYNLVLP